MSIGEIFYILALVRISKNHSEHHKSNFNLKTYVLLLWIFLYIHIYVYFFIYTVQLFKSRKFKRELQPVCHIYNKFGIDEVATSSWNSELNSTVINMSLLMQLSQLLGTVGSSSCYRVKTEPQIQTTNKTANNGFTPTSIERMLSQYL